ncbi:MAG: ATP-binding protein [Anaerolineales bacterium]|nr:ATP-binding protein [Anaerolineales bacterium]
MEDYEKLGSFYLGRVYDLKAQKPKDELLLYDSKDLVTHAVCVGMTGSGKTGLCLALIEEAAIDGVPAILIDPKGDLANLLLTFPQLRGEDFLPWINLDDARQKGMSPEEYANKQADTWKNGLAGWGQSGERIQRLLNAVEMHIYTPGSNTGIPVSILKSFAAPEAAIRDDNDLLRERISTTVTSLLGLVGIEADPVQSREHILLSTILDHTWRQGQDMDLAALIQQVQTPPLTKIGVLDLESFYPSKERFGLVMALNNLLASPGFSTWLKGIPLDIGQILYTPGGKPRVAIFSIAHLSDPERMFFVSLLMNQVLGWMRGQSGTTSLRALVYMDEIFGYLPPLANPPSKLPMLTLLKQARAFGIGIVLATQNPVDLDYKALSNIGTWFIGRLQTERDKARLLDGLESAAAGAQFNRGQIEKILSSLGNRVFLMNNTHEDAPELMQTRWVLSYMRGPLTRDQIKVLMDPLRSTATSLAPQATPAGPSPVSAETHAIPPAVSSGKPALPPGISEFFLPARGSGAAGNKLVYEPKIIGAAKINFADAKAKVNVSESKVFLTPITDDAIPVTWDSAEEISIPATDLEKSARAGAQFGNLPACASQAKNYTAWSKDFTNWLYGSQAINLNRSPSLKEVSQPGEDERDFRIRMQQLSREKRDDMVEALRKKYASKIVSLQERQRKAQAAVQKQQEQANQAKMQTALSVGATLLGAFTGRKALSSTVSRASSAARRAGRAMEESGDVARANETAEAVQQQLADLQTQFDTESAALAEKLDPLSETLETISIKPKKADILVQLVSLAWVPYWQDEQGNLTPAW